jgi:hypothetical protein
VPARLRAEHRGEAGIPGDVDARKWVHLNGYAEGTSGLSLWVFSDGPR